MNARILKKLSKRIAKLAEAGLYEPNHGEQFILEKHDSMESHVVFDRKHRSKYNFPLMLPGTVGFGHFDYWGEWYDLDAWSDFIEVVTWSGEDKRDASGFPVLNTVKNPSHAFKLAYENGVIHGQ